MADETVWCCELQTALNGLEDVQMILDVFQ
jgi:hypothetical protein